MLRYNCLANYTRTLASERHPGDGYSKSLHTKGK